MTSSAVSEVNTRFGHLRQRVLSLPWTHSFRDATYDFFMKSSAPGLKHIVNPKRGTFEKTFWLTLEIIAVSFAFSLIFKTWTDFSTNPTITTLDNQNYPVQLVPFPAIAFCNTNRLSRKAVLQYAEELVEKAKQYQNEDSKGFKDDVTTVFEKLRYLGRLIDFDIEGYEIFLNFQDNLESIDQGPNGEPWNVDAVMERLIPTCDDMMVKCMFENLEYNCSDLFELRKTSIGHCCVFNTNRKDGTKFTEEKNLIYPPGLGPEVGLNVVFNTSTDDYYYQEFSFSGIFFMLFDPSEFPDPTLGNTRNEMFDSNTENFVRVAIVANDAEPEVKNYDVEKRTCLFRDGYFSEYHGLYTFTECLLKCRIKSILDLCNCIPYFLPQNHEDLVTNTTTVCTLNSIPCLNKYRIKWRTMAPSTPNIAGLEQEYQDSLSCPHCYSLCSFTLYTLEATFNPITKNPAGGFLSEYNDTKDLTMVHVYYADSVGNLYKTSVLLTWYDLVSNFGGLMSLILSCSIVSLIEFIYYYTYRFYQYLNRAFDDEKDDLKISLKKEMYPSKKAKAPPNYSAIERTLYDEYQKRHFPMDL